MKDKHSDIQRATNLEEIQSLLDDGYRLIVFENNEDGDCVSMIGNDRATETTRRSFQNRRVTNLREFCALFDEGKPFIILKDDETGLYLKHEIAEIVDGNVKLTEPNDIWDVILLQGKEETKK